MHTNSGVGVAVPPSLQSAAGSDADKLGKRSRSGPLSSVHVANSYMLGGSGRVLAELCRCLPAAGVRFSGAVAEPDDVRVLSGGRVELFASSTSSIRNRLKGGRQTLLQLIEAEKADILASHFALYGASVLDKLYRRRTFAFVNHFHGPWAAESAQEGASARVSLAKKALERVVYHRADRVIVLSRAFARIAAEHYGIPEDLIRVVPGSVDIDRFNTQFTRQQAREFLGLPLDRPLLVTVRRLVNRMGLRHLLEAMREVARAVPDALLLIGGEGPLQEILQKVINEFGLQQSVRLLGFVPDEQLPLVYRAADLNVLTSQALEGFGLVAVEALAAGTPSMVTPVGGLPEVVSGLNSSLIFTASTPAAIGDQLIAAVKGTLALPTESECRDFAKRNYTSTLMAERTARIYHDVVHTF